MFKKEGKYLLISGHYRVEALKREFGQDYSIEVVVHDYAEENILRGMVVENLTQRDNEFREELGNFVLIRKYLQKNNRSPSERMAKRPPQCGGRTDESGSVRDISDWLNKHQTVTT